MSKIKHIYHRKDGRWEYTFLKDGQKTYLIASTKEKLLEKIKKQKEEQKIIKLNYSEENSKNTVVGWAKYWLKTYKSHIGKNNYDYIINKHLTNYFKNMKLSQLTPAILQEFINTLTPGSRTLDYAYLTLKQMLKQAYANDKTTRNLAETLTKPRKPKRIAKTALSLKEQQLFLEELKNYDEDIQSFMMFCLIAGARRQETKNFKLENIDEEKQKIFIDGTKTEQSRRKIKVSKEFINYLKSRKETTPYFTRQPHYYSDIAKDIFDKQQIKGKTLHDLRHTCSTNLHYLGWPDKERQEYLGHASIIMTNDIYTNLQEDITKEGLIKLYNNLYIKF